MYMYTLPLFNATYEYILTAVCPYQHALSLSFIFTTLVHSKNGTRIGCGLIEKVPVGQGKLLSSSATNLTKTGVMSKVVVQTIEPDIACYFGGAQNLEPNLVSFLNKNKTLMGMNCNVTNGCGVHIHNGTSCFNTTTQGGHYYNKSTYPNDPWLLTMYHATDSVGSAYYTGCAETGVRSFAGFPFMVHSNNGTRVACGLLQGDGPTSAPNKAPSTPKKCGLFGLSIFCPFTGCGIIGRWFGLCLS